MATDPEPSQEKIDRLAHSLFPSLAMLAAMQLDLFTPLARGPMGPKALAHALGVRPEKLRPLLDALVVADLLRDTGDGLFANTAEADAYLVKGRPGYRGGAHELYADVWPAVFQTAETIRTGRPQAPHDFSRMDDAALASFFRGLHDASLAKGRQLLEADIGLDRCRHVLDVGGGSGGIAIALCHALPGLAATVVELPRVAPITRTTVAEAGLQDRITVVERDAISGPPPGAFDAAIVSSVIQVLDPADAAALLSHVGRAVKTGGRIAVTGRIMNDDRRTPPHVVLFNLVFLNVYDGGLAHTEAEYRQWLTAAGFTAIERRTIPGTELITGVRDG